MVSKTRTSPGNNKHVDFEAVFNASPERLVLFDTDAPRFTILAASNTYLDLVNKERDKLLGQGLFEIFPEVSESDQHLLREAMEAVAKDGLSRSLAAYRYDIADPDEPDKMVERYWSPSLLPMTDDEGNVDTILVRVEEATDSLLRYRFRSRRLSGDEEPQTQPRRVLVVEPDLQLRKCLVRTLNIHWETEIARGATEALELLQNASFDLVLTAMHLPDMTGAEFIRAAKQAVDIPIIVRADQVHARCYTQAFEAGADDVIGGPASAREVIARVQTVLTEAQLRRAIRERVHHQYHQLFMQAPVAISLLEGPDKIYTLANPALYDIVGDRSLLGKPLRDAFPERELQPIFDRLEEVYETGEPYFRSEQPIFTKDGSKPRYVTFSYQPFRDADGSIRGVASFAYDVTEQVQMRKAVERENERKDVFLAMLGHELRNPLTPIVLAHDLLEEKARDGDDEELDWIAESLGRHIEQLEHHVNDLLDVAGIQHGRVTIERSAVALSKILNPAIEAAEASIRKKDQHLSLTRPDDDPLVDVDAARITQVVTNLLDNASKFTPSGGHIWLKAEVQKEADEHRLMLSVRDDGEGIESDLLPDLFNLFAQAKPSLARSRGGLGLGLALVKGIVEMHGGEIDVHSDGPGKGSCFTIRIPVTPAESQNTLSPAPAGKLEEARILLIEDLPEVSKAIARLFERRGATTYSAPTGIEGIEMAQQCNPTHIFVDIGLPDIDGYEVVRRLRKLPPFETTPIAALTGYGLSDDIQKAHKAGFDHHLTKPAGKDELVAFVTDAD